MAKQEKKPFFRANEICLTKKSVTCYEPMFARKYGAPRSTPGTMGGAQKLTPCDGRQMVAGRSLQKLTSTPSTATENTSSFNAKLLLCAQGARTTRNFETLFWATIRSWLGAASR
jgi:hypothetical protein